MTKSHSQWWLGIMSGVNKTTINVGDKYSVITNLDGEPISKKYTSKGIYGNQLGVILTLDIYAGFALSTQPKVVNYKFGYQTEFDWQGDGTYSSTYEHSNKLQYVQFPLLLKYDFISSNFGGRGKNPIKPFVQIGGAYSLLNNASKSISESGEFNTIEYENQPYVLDVNEQIIRSEWQWMAGAGLNIDINSFRFALVWCYHQGFNNISDKQNRYNNLQQSTDYYDVFDDMKLKGWTLNAEAIFPLKFIYDPHYRKSK